MKKLFCLLLLFVSLILGACSVGKIEPDPLTKYFIEIKEGEEVTIQWDFKNADAVNIDGYDKKFKSKDFLVEKLSTSKQYKLRAFNKKDTLVQSIYVEVKQNPREEGEIKTGPIVLKSRITSPSYIENEYLSGILNDVVNPTPANLRIMKSRIDTVNKTCDMNVVLLDNFGNYLKGFSKLPDYAIFNTRNSCKDKSATYDKLEYKEKEYTDPTDLIDFGILIDNSAAASQMQVANSVKAFLPEFYSGDKVMMSFYNQNYSKYAGLTPVEQVILSNENGFNLQPQSGLSALNKAALKSLNTLKDGANPQKALVIISFLADNSSLSWDENDVARRAKEFNIPLYIIGVGDAVNGYDLRYLCSLTGGRYYFLLNDEVNQLQNILSEILFSLRNHYTVTVPIGNFDADCPVKKANLQVITASNNISDNVTIQTEYKSLFSYSQILTVFDEKSATPETEYLENIMSLAELLKMNPDKNIQLVSHTWQEGSSDFSSALSSQRLETIKALLVSSGVKDNQVILKSAGDSKPIFPYQKEGWQSKMNRRIEVRWLDPEILPFELTGNLLKSEETAQSTVEQWENRGYKAYYERVFDGDEVGYRLKLWGYSSLQEAKQSSDLLKTKYSAVFTIDN